LHSKEIVTAKVVTIRVAVIKVLGAQSYYRTVVQAKLEEGVE
jgi:hypothetical protein